jgi:hypothetical protein
VAGGAAINGRATRSVGVLGHVGRDPDPPEFSDHSEANLYIAILILRRPKDNIDIMILCLAGTK